MSKFMCNYFATTWSRWVRNHSKQSRCRATILDCILVDTL